MLSRYKGVLGYYESLLAWVWDLGLFSEFTDQIKGLPTLLTLPASALGSAGPYQLTQSRSRIFEILD